MKVEYDFVVLMHLLPAVVNADMSGLTDEEEAQLNALCEEVGGHWYPVYDEEFPEDLVQYMAKCDVTGLIGWCAEIRVG